MRTPLPQAAHDYRGATPSHHAESRGAKTSAVSAAFEYVMQNYGVTTMLRTAQG
jgi:hypothetical protein